MIETLMDQIRVRDRQIQQLQRGIDLLQERIREMSKYGTDERGWPLVPCDPAAIPEGYEAVKVTWPTKEETFSCGYRERVVAYSVNRNDDTFSVCLVIRPIKPPIQLPLSIVPHGWWIRRNHRNKIFISKNQPELISMDWYTRGEVYEVPQPIAASLPKEWRELPWEQSLMQQQEGGEE